MKSTPSIKAVFPVFRSSKALALKMGLAACVLHFSLSSSVLAQKTDDDWDDFKKVVSKELRSKLPSDQVAAVEKFAEHDYEEAGEFLLKLMVRSSTPTAVANACSEVHAGFSDEDIVEKIARTVKSRPDANYYLLKTYLKQEQSEEEKVKVCTVVLARSRKTPCLTMAIEALKGAPLPEKGAQFLATKLSEKNYPSVRRAAADTLGTLKSSIPIPELIKNVGDHVTGDASRASLFKLTGQKFGTQQDIWAKWWEDNGKTFEVKEQTDSAVTAYKAEEEKKRAEDPAVKEASFYGKPVEGKNILFMLDKSGSMKGERMKTLKSELIGLIQEMGEDRAFGFVMFPHASFPTRGIDTAKESYKKRAIKFAEGLEVTGTTPISGAVEYAFDKVVKRHNVDTIYLLSDGAPNKPAEEVRKLIEQKNLGLYVKIHCVSIGADSAFLKSVAQDHNGDYWSAR